MDWYICRLSDRVCDDNKHHFEVPVSKHECRHIVNNQRHGDSPVDFKSQQNDLKRLISPPSAFRVDSISTRQRFAVFVQITLGLGRLFAGRAIGATTPQPHTSDPPLADAQKVATRKFMGFGILGLRSNSMETDWFWPWWSRFWGGGRLRECPWRDRSERRQHGVSRLSDENFYVSERFLDTYRWRGST